MRRQPTDDEATNALKRQPYGKQNQPVARSTNPVRSSGRQVADVLNNPLKRQPYGKQNQPVAGIS